MKKVDAVVIKTREKSEVRCGNCGKLLFICKFFPKISEKQLTDCHDGIIIVSRCPRNDCKTDNLLVISNPS